MDVTHFFSVFGGRDNRRIQIRSDGQIRKLLDEPSLPQRTILNLLQRGAFPNSDRGRKMRWRSEVPQLNPRFLDLTIRPNLNLSTDGPRKSHFQPLFCTTGMGQECLYGERTILSLFVYFLLKVDELKRKIMLPLKAWKRHFSVLFWCHCCNRNPGNCWKRRESSRKFAT
jgi:hypothetical protein